MNTTRAKHGNREYTQFPGSAADLNGNGLDEVVRFVRVHRDRTPGWPCARRDAAVGANTEASGTIATPKRLTDLIVGDQDGKTLYVTGFGSVYRIPVKVTGWQ